MNPFVKWAGGKRQLMTNLLELKPKSFNKYFEFANSVGYDEIKEEWTMTTDQ